MDESLGGELIFTATSRSSVCLSVLKQTGLCLDPHLNFCSRCCMDKEDWGICILGTSTSKEAPLTLLLPTVSWYLFCAQLLVVAGAKKTKIATSDWGSCELVLDSLKGVVSQISRFPCSSSWIGSHFNVQEQFQPDQLLKYAFPPPADLASHATSFQKNQDGKGKHEHNGSLLLVSQKRVLTSFCLPADIFSWSPGATTT